MQLPITKYITYYFLWSADLTASVLPSAPAINYSQA